MSVEFTVLASGSRGNASLIRSGGSGLLIDLGLGSRLLSGRLEQVGASWGGIASALLTHTHGDHVSDAALAALARFRIPLYCHEAHRDHLARGRGYQKLESAGCVRTYDNHPFLTPDGKRVEPIVLSHDGGPTYGFRVETRAARRGRPVSVGYVADTGCWRRSTAEGLMDVDVLGVEFNHDVEMTKQSGRPFYLIRRNLGDRGHLSNDQGAALVSAILAESGAGSVRHVVLLHLSDECNLPTLALGAARAAVKAAGRSSRIHIASQWEPHPHLPVPPRAKRPAIIPFPWEQAEATPFRLAAE